MCDVETRVRREISVSNVRSLTADEGVQQQNVQHVMTCRRTVSTRAKRVHK